MPLYVAIFESIFSNSVLHFRGWLDKQNIEYRRVTTASQSPRSDPVEVKYFVDAANHTILSMGLAGYCVINTDETNLPYEHSAKTTLERSGARSVPCKTTVSTGNYSVALAVTLDGQTLPPMIIIMGMQHSFILPS